MFQSLIYWPRKNSQGYWPIDLCQCHGVQKYCFADMRLHSERCRAVHDHCVLEILSRNPSHRIKEVEFEIMDGLPKNRHNRTMPEMLSKHWATSFDWVRLVEIASNQFRTLELLRIKWCTGVAALGGPDKLATAVIISSPLETHVIL